MSRWTHITSCISIDTTLLEKPSLLKKIIKKELKDAPKITGSEGPADVFVNVKSGHNFFTSRDCLHCEYYSKTDDISVGCSAPEGQECKEGDYQTCVVISVQGDLRDCVKEETQKEFDEFLKYIKCRYWVRDYSLNIEED